MTLALETGNGKGGFTGLDGSGGIRVFYLPTCLEIRNLVSLLNSHRLGA